MVPLLVFELDLLLEPMRVYLLGLVKVILWDLMLGPRWDSLWDYLKVNL